MGLFNRGPSEKEMQRIANNMINVGFNRDINGLMSILRLRCIEKIDDELFMSKIDEKWFDVVYGQYLFRFYQLGFTYPDEYSFKYESDKDRYYEEMNNKIIEVHKKMENMYSSFDEEIVTSIKRAFGKTLRDAEESGKRLRLEKLPPYELCSY